MTVTIQNLDPSFTFNNGKTWIIEIKKTGIKFNREEFPKWDADDFSKAFIDILEISYDVTFEKRKKIHDRLLQVKDEKID